MSIYKCLLLVTILGLSITSAFGQSFQKIAEDTIQYLKAGTFGKPDVARRSNRMALAQVRVHYKMVTTSAVSTRDGGAKVTVYLDGEMTVDDMQRLTDEFYKTLQRKLGALGIQFVDWQAISATEYFKDRSEAKAQSNNVEHDAGNGQAWVSYAANKGPVFYRYSVDQTRMFGNELLTAGKLKKIAKFCEALDAEFASVDAVVDFTAVDLSTSKDVVWEDERKYLKYGANVNVAPLMSVPQSYVLLTDRKSKFDQYGSKLPIGQRDFFAEKPVHDPEKAALKTRMIFGDRGFTFTPVVVNAKRELYISAARRALELYADMFAEKLKLIRMGEKPSDTKGIAQKPADDTDLKQVNEAAKQANQPTAVTTNELREAARQAQKEGKFRLAADYYGELIKKDPTIFEYYLSRGAILLNELKNYKAAVKDFDQMIKLNPNEPAGFYNRATAFLFQSDWKKAKSDYDSALRLKPDLVEAYLNRGIVNLNLKDYEAALVDFNRGIELAPRVPNLYRARAIYYKVKKNAALAQADELRAAQLERGQ
jgi:tetratricopeptide (TPR) repeat protein